MAYYRRGGYRRRSYRRGRVNYRQLMYKGKKQLLRKQYRKQNIGIKAIYSSGQVSVAVNALSILYAKYRNYLFKVAMACRKVAKSVNTSGGDFGNALRDQLTAKNLAKPEGVTY